MHVGHAGSLSGTSQARARYGRGNGCGPTLHGSWSQGSSPGSQVVSVSTSLLLQRGLHPLNGRHRPRKGVKVRSAHMAWVETFLAN